MGKKYSINSAGNIVAERDIYSLGGFIPKGRAGGKVASEKQLSQDGECWLAGGNISTRPDVRIKDNAYIGDFFADGQAVHTDGITEFSGNTLIPGYITIRSLATDTKNNVFVKDSFIGVSMDVLCGPASNTTAFPFEQGGFKAEAAKGTLFTSASMRLDDTSACRSTATLRPGRNAYLYIPTGYRARVYWAYYDNSNQLAYSGESTAIQAGLIKLNPPVYRLAMVTVAKADGTAMTPANLLATGAKILGHIGGSLLQDLRPESASGQYVMANSSFIAETSNFGLNTTQLRFLAGGMYNTTMYTKTDRPDYKPYGTFRNVERLEYTKYLSESYRTAATRDTYISAYDCPLLRIDSTTYNDALAAKGDLVLRRCIVPKGRFVADLINGNTYEDLDFSYVNEFMGQIAGNRTLVCSHRQGLYSLYAVSGSLTGLVSYPENTKNATSITEKHVNIPLDGNIIEQGAYGAGGVGSYYEASKSNSPIRVRTGKPLPTFGLVLPSLPDGYSVKALYYLDDDFIIRSTVTDPTELATTYPYVVMLFRKDDDSAINVTDFIALNRTLRIIDSTKTPEITGSAYVGAGCTVRGDVKLIGDPYVNRVLDVNLWERKALSGDFTNGWEAAKITSVAGNRFVIKDLQEIEIGATISCAGDYRISLYKFDSGGSYLGSDVLWVNTYTFGEVDSGLGVAYVGILIKKHSEGLITEGDLAIANVKYLRAFKKRRYITNELDRTSPEDILLGPEFFEQGNLALTAGGYYELAKRDDVNRLRFKRLLNAGRESTSTGNSTYVITKYAFDAITRFIAGGENLENRALAGNLIRKEPESAITPDEISFSRMVIEFTPSPRIIVPYGTAALFISGPKIRMYDNAVLSRNLNNQEGEIILQGDAVMGYDFNAGSCMCSNGHDDAIIKKP